MNQNKPAVVKKLQERFRNVSVGRGLYIAFVMPTMLSMFSTRAFAADTIWTKASAIMQDVYKQILRHIDVDCLSNRVFFAKNGIHIIRKIVHYAIRGFHFSMRRTIAAACPQLTDRYRLIVRVFRRALLCFVYVAYSKEKEYNEKSHYRQTISYSKGLPLLFGIFRAGYISSEFIYKQF